MGFLHLQRSTCWRSTCWCLAAHAVVLALVTAAPVLAQTGVLTGTITDTAGEPLPGATVQVQALQRGVITDIDGGYSLALPAGAHTVRISFVAFRTETRAVEIAEGETLTLDVVLRDDLVGLDEVVVTGQGASIERRRMTTDIEVLDLRTIEEAQAANVAELLQGRVPGAQIRAVSGQPGQGARINLRGVTSFSNSTTPVIYIDGVRVDNAEATGIGVGGEYTSTLADLVPADIERIEITKGGAASTLYGAEAANGVIQIFTKKGIAGRGRITIRTEQGIDQPVLDFVKDTGFVFPDETGDPQDPNFGRTDFLADEFFRTGTSQNYYVSASGGAQGLTYLLSGQAERGEGVQPQNDNALYALRGSLGAELTPQLRAQFSGSYVHSRFNRLFAGRAFQDPVTAFEVGDAFGLTGAATFDEALGIFLSPNIEEEVDRFTISAGLQHAPSQAFDHKLSVGLDYRANEQRIFEPIDYPVVPDRQGRLDRYNRDFSSVTLEYVGVVRWPREGRLTSDLTFGVQGFRTDESVVEVFAEDFTLPGVGEFDSAVTKDATEARVELFNGGVFVQNQLGLDDRLFLDLGLRLDGNSAFGDEVGLVAFPKAGLAYNLHQIPGFQERLRGILSALKLRVAYGATGNFPSPFASTRSFDAFPFLGESALFVDNPGNDDLRPERTATLEGGFDAGFLNDRLSLKATLYNARTTDALLSVPEQPTVLGTSQVRNVGTISNTGLELEATARVLDGPRVGLTIGGYFHTFTNEVEAIDVDVTDLNIGPSYLPGGDGLQIIEAGRPISAWRVTVPIDTDGDGLLDGSDVQFTGETAYLPTTGGLSIDLTLFRQWSFRAVGDFAVGGQVLDLASRWAALNGIYRVDLPRRYPSAEVIQAGIDAGTFVRQGDDVFQAQDGVIVTDPDGNPVLAGRRYSPDAAQSFLLQDADFFKLREIGVRYSVPKAFAQRLRLEGAEVYFNVRNVLTVAASDLVDPELSGLSGTALDLGGASANTVPQPRQFRLGLQITI
ncbi:MAG: SusC/RagA family TonB-linked outer membrane protein [Bacteroidota bacterium]